MFVRNVLRILDENKEPDALFHTQLVVTTHSPHILYERGFSSIRYFRRVSAEMEHQTDVRNLSRFKSRDDEKEALAFLQRYLKLTHCDLFFSDAAILVEGNVERLLLPAMIERCASRLRSSALTLLEVGGAFAHRFRELIEFLGLTTLVITDLDSVTVKSPSKVAAGEGAGAEGDAADAADESDEILKTFEVDEEVEAGGSEQDGKSLKRTKTEGSTCYAHEPNAVTANQTLISWIPQKRTVEELWAVSADEKVVVLEGGKAHVRVAYQTPVSVTVGGTQERRCGRTLEEAFGLDNAVWCQEKANASVGLRLRKAAQTPEELATGLHNRVKSGGFDKTRFALEVLASGPLCGWKVPTYISEGLIWLQDRVAYEAEADTALVAGAPTAEQAAGGGVAIAVELQPGASK